MNKKGRKTTLALLSIGIVILTILLLPKREEKHYYYEPPRSGVRYIPAPTPTPPNTLKSIDPSHELPKAILPKDLQ